MTMIGLLGFKRTKGVLLDDPFFSVVEQAHLYETYGILDQIMRLVEAERNKNKKHKQKLL